MLILCVLSRTVPWKASVARVPARPPCRRPVFGGMRGPALEAAPGPRESWVYRPNRELEARLNSARSGPPCCCSCHCSPDCDAAAGINFFAARARKTHQQWKWDPHEKITQIQGGDSTHPQVRGWCCSRGAQMRPVLRGQAGGLAVAELEATHTCVIIIYIDALIMSLSSLPLRPSNCTLKLEAELNSAQSDLPCCCTCHCSPNGDDTAGTFVSSLRGQGRPINNGSGTRTKK